jgi:benzodiazapine receptor
MTRARSITVLVVCMLSCLAVGALGSLATATSVTTWYPLLDKPAWTPPAAVFGPVWTLLYISTGVAFWLVWTSPDRSSGAIGLFAVQLLLNAAWSFVFFGMRSPRWAFFEIVLLWIAISATLVAFWRVRRAAAALLVPYLAWVTFAAALNLAIWKMNP